MLPADESQRYARQIALPEIGLGGQERLRAGRVLLIGAGGLGSPAALYLAAAGVGTLGIVDPDEVELSNLHRQILHGSGDLGRAKVDSAAERLAGVNPHVRVEPIRGRFTAANALIAGVLILPGLLISILPGLFSQEIARSVEADAAALGAEFTVAGEISHSVAGQETVVDGFESTPSASGKYLRRERTH